MLFFYLALIDESDDKEIFKQIYNNHKKLMYHIAYSILNNKALADEAVQEALFNIAKNISVFTNTESNRTAALITIIIRNVSISLQRKEKYERGGNETINIEDVDYELPAVSDNITVQENYDLIVSAVKSLDATYSDVMILKYVYGFTNKIIAHMLSIPIRTVDSRLYRGKKNLVKKLEEEYND